MFSGGGSWLLSKNEKNVWIFNRKPLPKNGFWPRRCEFSNVLIFVCLFTLLLCSDLESNETSDDLPSIAVFGDLNLIQPSLTHHQSMFDKKVHAQYNKTRNKNDIALLYLKNPVKKFGINISKIPLANESFKYSSCFVVGWGKTNGMCIPVKETRSMVA